MKRACEHLRLRVFCHMLSVWCATAIMTHTQSAHAEGASKGVSLWSTIFIEARLPVLDRKLFLYLDSQMRLSEGGTAFTQGLFRPAIGYTLPHGFGVYLGYAAFFNAQEPGNPFQVEQRIWQQGVWKWKYKPFAVGLYLRSRLEQRFVADQAGLSWRFRQMVRFDWHFHPKSPVGIGIGDEIFLAFNEVSWSKPTGFTQNRAFAALFYLFSGGSRLEFAYMNQWFRTTTADQMVHIIMGRFFIFI